MNETFDLSVLKVQLRERIEELSGSVVLLGDFSDLADERQLLCGLDALVKERKIAQIGENVFAKVRKNRITGESMLDSPAGFDGVAKEALSRLGVRWEPCQAEQMYQKGGEQIPACTIVRVLEGEKPVLSFKGYQLLYE